MFDKIDFKEEPLSKREYKESYDALVKKLVVLQQQVRSAGVGLVVLFEGWNGAGKGSRISDLMYNLDARATSVCVPVEPDVEEERYFADLGTGVNGYFPFMQEYWKALEARGTITFYDSGWYSAAMKRYLAEVHADDAEAEEHARRMEVSIHDFEQLLVDNGYVVVKFFLHVRKKAQRKRLEALHKDPATRWRVPDKKLASSENYEESYELYDRILDESDFDFAPWTLINGEDRRGANTIIARRLVEVIEDVLAQKESADEAAGDDESADDADDGGTSGDASADGADDADEAAVFEARAAAQQKLAPHESRFPIVADHPRIDDLSYDLTLDRDAYKVELKRLQKELFRLESIMYQRRVPLMIMYEGWDAAGKGGNIKRVAQALDARSYTIFPSPAPTSPELAHPHLWRYWTRLPKAGHVGLYDRSWYGRVLVERVEGFATSDEWPRAYDEINAFERDMIDWGAILLKFWVDVSPDEQLARFEKRAADPSRQWKITDDDWRNRDKYPLYKAAIDDMFRLTSTTYAPWTVLESDNKYYARVKALRIIVSALRDRLGE